MCYSRYVVRRKGKRYNTSTGGKASYSEDAYVSCGKCEACLKRKANEYAFRMFYDSKKFGNCYFVTLTYDNDHVQLSSNRFATLVKEHLVLYMKRLRYYNEGKKLYYFACGEYGGKTFRPHYHIIVCNVDDPTIFQRAWDKGHVDVGNVTSKSCIYVTKYMVKDPKVGKHYRDDRIKEFRVISKQLGKSYISDKSNIRYHKNGGDVTRNCSLYFDGFYLPMPRYYSDVLYSENDKVILQSYWKQEAEKEDEKLRKRVKKYYGDSISLEHYKSLVNSGNIANQFYNLSNERSQV